MDRKSNLSRTMHHRSSWWCLLQVLLLAASGEGIEWTVGGVVGSVRTFGEAIIDPKNLPSPDRLLEGSKQVLAGYPFEYVSSSINYICE